MALSLRDLAASGIHKICGLFILRNRRNIAGRNRREGRVETLDAHPHAAVFVVVLAAPIRTGVQIIGEIVHALGFIARTQGHDVELAFVEQLQTLFGATRDLQIFKQKLRRIRVNQIDIQFAFVMQQPFERRRVFVIVEDAARRRFVQKIAAHFRRVSRVGGPGREVLHSALRDEKSDDHNRGNFARAAENRIEPDISHAARPRAPGAPQRRAG